MNIFVLVIAVLAVCVIGGGGAALLYFRTRPVKQMWTAYCYQVGEGVKEIKKDKDGNDITTLRLKDLIEYQKDLLIREEKSSGKTIYRLKNLNMTTQPPPADAISNWGQGEKDVNVLIDGSTATILKQGYDVNVGERIFTPMPRDRIELMISETEVKRNRLDSNKDILAQVMPFIAIGMALLSIIAIAYFMGQGAIKFSENMASAQIKFGEDQVKSAEIYRDALRGIGGVQKIPKTESNIYGKVSEDIEEPIETIK